MKLKPYPAYKDSGVSWLGSVPEHWQEIRLDKLFELRNEMPQVDDQPITGYLNGRVTLRSNIQGQKIKGVIKEAGWQRVYPGDFAISGMNAHLGGMGVSDALGKCSPIYLVLKPKAGTNAHFVSHSVRHIAHIGVLKSLVSTIRFNSADFKRNDLKLIRVEVPSNEEQFTIVRFLNHINHKIDRYIRAKKKLIALLNEQKQAIIHRAVTRGLDPNVRLKPSGIEWLGDIPEHWELVTAKQVSKIFIPQRDKPELNDQGGFDWITPVNIGDIFVSSTGLFVTPAALALAGGRIVPAGSVIASCVGRFGIASICQQPVVINQQLQAYLPHTTVSAKYLRYCVLISRPYFEMEGNSTTLAYVNRQGFGRMPLPLPKRSEQENIENYLETELNLLDHTTSTTQREIELIREYRTRLIADVVTGKLDVRNVDLPTLDPLEDLNLIDITEELENEELTNMEEISNADD
jgi:type I restriction enzyme, S subunit